MRALILSFAFSFTTVSLGCNVEPEPREPDCQAFLECYLDCRVDAGAFEDLPTAGDGQTTAQAHTMCYGGCAEDIQPPSWLVPDDLYPAVLSILYGQIHRCISDDDQSAGDGTA